MDLNINVKIISPNEPIGIIILFIGLIFTATIIYILYSVTTNKESIDDKNIRKKNEFKQKAKISKLYPKEKKL